MIDTALHTIEKNNKAHTRLIRDKPHAYREDNLLMDLLQLGELFEKKDTQFSKEGLHRVIKTYHYWQPQEMETIPEFCYSASPEEVAKKDFSLVPSKYIGFVNMDENIDFEE